MGCCHCSFVAEDLCSFDRLEQGLGIGQVLALRMLYAALDPEQRQGYRAFVQEVEGLANEFLEYVTPADVKAFVRHCAGCSQSDDLMMVWVFDDVHRFSAKYGSSEALPHLLSAFADFRVGSTSDTLPVCLVTSTMRSRVGLMWKQTAHAHHGVVDIQLPPFSVSQHSYILHTLLRRLELQQRQQQQQPTQQQQQQQ